MPHETLQLPGGVGDLPAEFREYAWDEILRHNTARDLWLVVGGNVYNLGKFLYHHPGGAEIPLWLHGRDATSVFLKVGHPEYALALTRSFLIGKLRTGAKPPMSEAWAPTSRAGRTPPTEPALREIPGAI